jgi:hypothetical protein
MNVIISNERQAELANLDIEIIKSIHGVFDADELIQMFSNFFFGRMILDLTALKNYQDVRNLQKLSMSLDVEKIIILLPDTPECLAPQFLSKLISMGIYNFTTNLDGVNYLLTNPNTYRDVAHLHQIDSTPTSSETGSTGSGNTVINNIVSTGTYILGIKNVTEHSGATMLTYMLKKELKDMGKSVLAIEVDKKDFMYFNDKEMISVDASNLANEVLRHKDVNVLLIDLNKCDNIDVCNEVLYLIEPSTIKLNKLMRRDRNIFSKLAGRKIVLAQSILSDSDIKEFEYEANIKIFFVMPPLDERENNSEVLQNLLNRIGIINY